MIVAGLLPLLCLALLMLAVRSRVGHPAEAVLLGAVCWGALVTGMTEALGAAGMLRFPVLLAVWGGTAALLLAAIVRELAAREPTPAAPGAPASDRRDRWLALPIVVFAGLTLVVALAAPPNTFDSMAYHMSRVAHWAANGSVDNYPTVILRQLHMAPFAEYAVLHLFVLGAGDRLANLVQWSAMCACVAGAAAIAFRLGAGPRAVLLAAVFTATLPIGILEATGTKNDYVAALWLLAAAWLVVVLRSVPGGGRREQWLALGAAAGLAMLSKATAYLFLAPFLAWLAVDVLRRRRWRETGSAALAAGLALALNAAFYARNAELTGSPIGATSEAGEHKYVNERMDAKLLASNVIRNTALQVATGSDRVDAIITRVVRKVHREIGVDPALPATTWMSIEFDAHQRWRHEDSAPNPLHFAVLLAAPLLLLRRRTVAAAGALRFLLPLAAGFVLFAAYLQWQPFHSRLHLPLLVLGAPVAGIALARLPGRWTAAAAAALLAIAGGPALLRNESRELAAARNVLNTPRSDQYFANWPGIAEAYHEAAARLRETGCDEVALVAWWNAYEYPLWALLGAPGTGVRLRHVAVDNPSARYAAREPDRPACAVVALARHEIAASLADSLALQPALDQAGIRVFVRQRR